MVYEKDGKKQFDSQDTLGKSITKSIVGKVSANIDVDSNIVRIRESSSKSLMRELSWAAHLGLPAVSIRIWLVFPMTNEILDPSGDDNRNGELITEDKLSLSPWHWWFNLSTLTADITDALGVVLELPKDLPDELVISRWFSEPIVCLLVHTDLFLTNAKGYPVLPKSHQRVIHRFFKVSISLNTCLILTSSVPCFK
ncbi:unnamed protein product [Trichobilharzia regenti]|nr:unnamed protein product [Trichobilharzia regenti]